MRLKQIRENYGKLLATLNDAGVKLSESQKSDLDDFVLAVQDKIDQTKRSTVRKTRAMVEAKYNAEFREVFESIMKHQRQHDALAGAIQTKIAKIKESKKMAKNLDSYLNLYLEEVLPKKKLVNYSKLRKLEALVESLKSTLLVNDEVIESKIKEIEADYRSERNKLAGKNKKLKKQLSEAIEAGASLKTKISHRKAKDLLERKTKDLPLFEAKQVKARLAHATVEEINSKFKKVLESVRDDMAMEAEEKENDLDAEISDILDKDAAAAADKNIDKADDAEDSDETEDDEADDAEDDTEDADDSEDEEDEEDADDSEDEEPADDSDSDSEEDAEGDSEDDSGDDIDDVELDDDEKVDSRQMREWIERYVGINPIG